MKSLASFWSACEKLAATGAMKEWEMLIRDSVMLQAAKGLLIPTSRQVSQFPCTNTPRCACIHEVINHRDGTMSACCICDDPECAPIAITDDDIVEYQADYQRIFRALAKAGSFELTAPSDIDISNPVHFGDCMADELLTIPVYFLMVSPLSSMRDALTKLLVGATRPMIVFSAGIPGTEVIGDAPWYRNTLLLFSIRDLFTIADDGRLAVSNRIKAAIEDFANCISAASTAKQICTALSESDFAPSGDYRTITIRGKVFQRLTKLQSDVIRIMHKDLLNGTRDVEYSAIACRIADLHTDERGFEPPDKMSQIFRSGDHRGDLVIAIKPGYYRLNI